jgi:phosphoribosylglycinamide formyltransferase 1
MARLRLAVLISGRGSNLQSLIDACADPGYPAEIALVVSNVPGAQGLDRAARAGIPTAVVDHTAFADRESFEAALDARIEECEPQLICLAGFMRRLTSGFVERWPNRIINIHPSLLPSFRGLHTHERVLAAGARFAGCTVHFVRADVDAGPILVQAAVPVHPDDDAETLAARVLVQEHRIYRLAVRLIAEGRTRVVNERVIVDGAVAPDGALLNPAGP